MRLFTSLLSMGLLVLPVVAFSAETNSEKLEDTANDVKREATAKANRLEEATCMESDLTCLGKKLKNRSQEASSAIKDKAAELKNSVDDD